MPFYTISRPASGIFYINHDGDLPNDSHVFAFEEAPSKKDIEYIEYDMNLKFDNYDYLTKLATFK